MLDLSWVPDGWWRLLSDDTQGDRSPERVKRRHFEACVFSQLMLELKAGDLCIVGSDAFADYRDQLVSWDTHQERVADYSATAGVPVDGAAFVEQVRDWLDATVRATDEGFPDNKLVRIENGEAIISRPPRKTESASVRDLESRLAEHIPEQHILDMLTDTEHWLHWTNPFGPISGHETKLEDAVVRYLATVFCYGTNMGPNQAARSLIGLDRRQIEWINQHHVVDDGLDEASMIVVNGYHRFLLTRAWGSGKHVSADGTQWDTYERNVLAERHIRYGGFGGVAYSHISDLYIALFSHFAFFPTDVFVNVGDKITWSFDTAEVHTVSFLQPGQAPPPATAPATPDNFVYNGTEFVNSGIPVAPSTYTVVFNATGDFNYLCLIHVRTMTARVHVNPAARPYPHTQAFYDRQAHDQARLLLDEGRSIREDSRDTARATNKVVTGGGPRRSSSRASCLSGNG